MAYSPALGFAKQKWETQKNAHFLQLARALQGSHQDRHGRDLHVILHYVGSSSLVSFSSCDSVQGFIEEFLQIFSSLLQEKR